MLAAFQSMRDQTFKRHIITCAFENLAYICHRIRCVVRSLYHTIVSYNMLHQLSLLNATCTRCESDQTEDHEEMLSRNTELEKKIHKIVASAENTNRIFDELVYSTSERR